MCRPCTPHTRTPLTQDGRQVHTCRAESALDGHSGFAHAVIMSVQTQSCGQCGIHAPLHGCTALPPGSVHAAQGKICLSVKISRRENISFLPDPSERLKCGSSAAGEWQCGRREDDLPIPSPRTRMGPSRAFAHPSAPSFARCTMAARFEACLPRIKASGSAPTGAQAPAVFVRAGRCAPCRRSWGWRQPEPERRGSSVRGTAREGPAGSARART